MGNRFSLKALLLAGLLLLACPGQGLTQTEGTPTIGAFAFGRGGKAAQVAVDVQRSLREFIHTTGLYKNSALLKILETGAPAPREKAIQEARSLLEKGRADYEQLDLEKAQAKFMQALKKLEYGYGYLEDQALLLEITMHLGATWVLVGEPEKAAQLFLSAHDLPGPKVLDPNLFPPNIQDIFNQAMQEAESASRGGVKLITDPQGAQIHIDGTYRGGSPLVAEDLRAGSHMVRALKDGYRPWGGKITVTEGKIRNFKMKLKPTRKQRGFTVHYKEMVREAFVGQPDKIAKSLAGFIGASYLAIVVVEGSPQAMTLRGYHCEVGETLGIALHQEVLDTTDDSFSEKLSGYFGALLATTPEAHVQPTGEPGFSEGEAAAAALLAKADSGEEESGDSFGLDLGTSAAAAAETETQESKTDESGDKLAMKTEEEEKTGTDSGKIIEDSLKDARREEKTDGEPSTWGYLASQWWFWTAVGVVVAGAATGTYFLATSGEEGGGRLILGLH
jgi:tetratricopeptide (TPR) repeat protein